MIYFIGLRFFSFIPLRAAGGDALPFHEYRVGKSLVGLRSLGVAIQGVVGAGLALRPLEHLEWRH